jgi:hypothetical protein
MMLVLETALRMLLRQADALCIPREYCDGQSINAYLMLLREIAL